VAVLLVPLLRAGLPEQFGPPDGSRLVLDRLGYRPSLSALFLVP